MTKRAGASRVAAGFAAAGGAGAAADAVEGLFEAQSTSPRDTDPSTTPAARVY